MLDTPSPYIAFAVGAFIGLVLFAVKLPTRLHEWLHFKVASYLCRREFGNDTVEMAYMLEHNILLDSCNRNVRGHADIRYLEHLSANRDTSALDQSTGKPTRKIVRPNRYISLIAVAGSPSNFLIWVVASILFAVIPMPVWLKVFAVSITLTTALTEFPIGTGDWFYWRHPEFYSYTYDNGFEKDWREYLPLIRGKDWPG